MRVQRKRFDEWKKAGSADFENGNVASINSELALDEQVHLLPYNKAYEFPREKLEIGKILGSGFFGVVHQAVAHGIVANEDKTTVAIKMVKKMASNEVDAKFRLSNTFDHNNNLFFLLSNFVVFFL